MSGVSGVCVGRGAGAAKELGMAQVGSFRCLNGKVDLSTHEAEHTVRTWETKLRTLRHELAVRTIARNITGTQVPYTVKVLAHQNGAGRNSAPQLIIGSSIDGVRTHPPHSLTALVVYSSVTTAAAPASEVEAVVRSPTNMAAAKTVDFSKMMSK